MNVANYFDADEYFRSGNCPWTFFAYPTNLADEVGFPPDAAARELFVELQKRGLRVGVWVNGIAENTTYFACPKEEIRRLWDTITELEKRGAIEKDFLSKHSDQLFAKDVPKA